jgi:hypothetical protein
MAGIINSRGNSFTGGDDYFQGGNASVNGNYFSARDDVILVDSSALTACALPTFIRSGETLPPEILPDVSKEKPLLFEIDIIRVVSAEPLIDQIKRR